MPIIKRSKSKLVLCHNIIINTFLNFRKWSGSSSSTHASGVSTSVQSIISTPVAATTAPTSPAVDVSGQNADVTDGEWTYDPNEPRYCLCNQVSYGDMVACDNEDVCLI